MPDFESTALRLLADQLDAVTITAEPCDYCGQPVGRTESGALQLAAPCDKAKRHITFMDNALRIEFGMEWEAYWAKIDRYGPPSVNRAAWTQPKDKARRWQPNTRWTGGVVHPGDEK